MTRVGTNGKVVGEPGSVLVIQQDGLTAIPATYGVYWYSNFKGGRIKGSVIQHGGSVAISERRPLQVGEKVYLVTMEMNQAEIVLYVQSCGTCDAAAPDASEVPYRARLAFGFQKGYLTSSTPKEIQDTIGQVFAIEVGQPIRKSEASTSTASSTETPLMKLPSTYVSAQAQTDWLRLDANQSFSLQEAGQSYHGTFVVNGNALELSIGESNVKTSAKIQGNKLIDSGGQTWVLQKRSAEYPPGEAVLRNEDVIKMAKAGLDDAIIVSKISSSKCQFDTSADTLVRLKQSGVSAAVLKAMVGAGK